ncbi:MAG TPA: hypothetical protein P5049_00380 [Methanothrix sp.]|nr:hypothetical protein [Methanothrix soehngenii]HRW81886.1 hypothetical protein [Methanothrix sp.]
MRSNPIPQTSPISDICRPGTDGAEVNYGEERYLGTYDITRKIGMESNYSKKVNKMNWLDCCIGGYSDVELAYDQTWVESEVFDCVCS